MRLPIGNNMAKGIKQFHLALLIPIMLILCGCKSEQNEKLTDNNAATVKIAVKDLTPPVIDCKDSFSIQQGSEFDLKQHIKVSDNVDENLSFECIGSYDTMTSGQYIMQIKAVDSSGNEACKNISIAIIPPTKQEPNTEKQLPQVHTQVKPSVKIQSRDYLYSDGYDMNTAGKTCSSDLHASGKSGSCEPIQDANGIYVGMRLEIYE